jgi:hypothetical protein
VGKDGGIRRTNAERRGKDNGDKDKDDKDEKKGKDKDD